MAGCLSRRAAQLAAASRPRNNGVTQVKITNITKWFFALPFAFFIALVVPGVVAGSPLWFSRQWADTLYVVLTGGMWLFAAAFVDASRSRGSPDLANRLIPLGLILTVPAAVWDRTHWIASKLPEIVSIVSVFFILLAVFVGLASRIYLGGSYAPRPGHSGEGKLVRDGPYRWIRHPMYAAALLWIVGWPLVIASFLGMAVAAVFVVPAIWNRMIAEENQLLRIYGDEYANYQKITWRLFPYIY